ncbi:MAG: helix-turn-helix transcriptional regulator [Clostridia bacterium]|nr:helix-turn-helix transcriptional regulator [Clostridia bacterium]
MKIGEKIKKLRTAKLMTQSELVGNEITRNMLSRIENGSANPSLETVCYIAGRLNVSPGFLLAEEGDEQIYFKHSEIVGIKKALLSEDYRICRDICLNSESFEDDEIQLILSECNLAIAKEEFGRGNLRVACECFDETIESCEKTLYRTDHLVSVVGVYFRYMQQISPTLSSNFIDEEEVNVYPALVDEFCRYALAFEQFTQTGTSAEWMHIEERKTPYTLHLDAMIQMREENYDVAYELLHEILLGEVSVPEPMLYFVFCDLEICCRERQDFKGAYEYSMDKIELLQKLLT